MKALIRPLFAVAVAFLLAACLFGLRSACDPAGLRNLIQEDRRNEELLQFMYSSVRHIESREQVVRELIAQRCSLSDAIARCQELDREWLQEVKREWPDSAFGLSESYRLAWTDADYYYRLITVKVARFLRDQPEEAALVLRRLEKEYQQLRDSRQLSSTEKKGEKKKKGDIQGFVSCPMEP